MSIENSVLFNILFIETLYKKNLLNACAKLLKKTKHTAYKHEQYSLLLKIIDWEIRLELKLLNKEDHIKTLLNEETAIQSNLQAINKLKNIYYKLYFLTHKNHTANRTKNLSHQLKKIIQSIQYKKTWPSVAKGYYFNSMATYYSFTSNANKELLYQKKILDLYNQHPQQIEVNPDRYISTISNYAYSLLRIENYKEMYHQIATIKNFNKKYNIKINTITETHIFYITNNIEMNWMIYSKNFKNIQAINDSITEGLKQHKKSINILYKQTLYYNIALLNFIDNNFNNALDWINNITLYSSNNNSFDIYYMAMLIKFITHFELRNYQLLNNSLNNFKKLLKNKRKLFNVEKEIIRFLTQYTNDPSPDKTDFIQFKKNLQNIISDPFEKSILKYFDFITWAESKIQNKSFKEVLTKRC